MVVADDIVLILRKNRYLKIFVIVCKNVFLIKSMGQVLIAITNF